MIKLFSAYTFQINKNNIILIISFNVNKSLIIFLNLLKHIYKKNTDRCLTKTNI